MGRKLKVKKSLDETHKIPDKKGNGILKFSVDSDENGNLVRYSLVYINTKICNVDNGRVLGYDNDHGYHHKHYMGKVEKINFISFDNINKLFETEWRALHDSFQEKK